MVHWGNDVAVKRGAKKFPEGVKVKALACGSAHSVAIKEDGTMVQWGETKYGQYENFPAGVKVKAVACGDGYSVAIKEDGTLVQWGNGATNEYKDFPEGVKVKAVSCGSHHSVAIKEDGTLVQWGDSSGNNQRNGFPAGVKMLALATKLSTSSSVAIKEDGTMIQWGYDTMFPAGVKVKAVAMGHRHAVAIKEDGTMVQWGFPYEEREGFPEGLKVKSVACGNSFSVAIKEDGTLVQWGDADFGRTKGFSDLERISPKTIQSVSEVVVKKGLPTGISREIGKFLRGSGTRKNKKHQRRTRKHKNLA